MGDKLTGVQLYHFGAFYRRSWRVNDWLQGRMDGIARLVEIVLSPERLRQLGYGSANALEAIELIAIDSSESTDRAYLEWDTKIAATELAFLDGPVDDPLPTTLPACARAISRRLQRRLASSWRSSRSERGSAE